MRLLSASPEMYFNPRSREGSDISAAAWRYSPRAISIHAPAKGATRIMLMATLTVPFQSTLPRRERRWAIDFLHSAVYFNPRSREGSDLFKFFLACANIPISIHAPAKGATRLISAFDFTIKHFNPRSREGSDDARLLLFCWLILFQSTLPRRERQQKSPRLFPMILAK